MENIIRLSKKDTKFLSKQFNAHKKDNDIDKMYVVLYRMRVLHGVMLVRLNKYSDKLWHQMKNRKEKTVSREYYNLSIYSSLIDSAKELVNNAENHLQKIISHENKSELQILEPELEPESEPELETDIENIYKDNISKPKFILFHVNWCGHCQNFLPIWKQFEKEMNGKNIHIEHIDCDENQEMCEKFKVKGYPTAILTMGKEIIEYDKPRTIKALKEFISEKINKK